MDKLHEEQKKPRYNRWYNRLAIGLGGTATTLTLSGAAASITWEEHLKANTAYENYLDATRDSQEAKFFREEQDFHEGHVWAGLVGTVALFAAGGYMTVRGAFGRIEPPGELPEQFTWTQLAGWEKVPVQPVDNQG